MSEGVMVALIGAQAVVLASVLPPLLSARKHAKRAALDSAETREHTSNDHKSNLRDDIDAVLAMSRSNAKDIHQIKGHLGILEPATD